MDSDKSVFELVKYGKIIIDVKSVMDKKKLTINQVVKRTGLHHRNISKYYNGEVTRFDADTLAKLCFVLECELENIMYYKK